MPARWMSREILSMPDRNENNNFTQRDTEWAKVREKEADKRYAGELMWRSIDVG